MPVEMLEAPIETSVSTVPIPTQELGGVRADISKFLPDKIRNEYNNEDRVTILKPKPIVIEGKDELAEEFNRTLEGNFTYYSRTRELEVGTDRTRIIQEVINRMAIGSDIETRVVIMRKGREPNAFVVPDGTIFISQSLLNRLDSLDEVAAVLAHELGHLINKTSIQSAEAGPGRFGIGWVHEAACDLGAPGLLEKAGFTSWAFSTAIEKVSGYERGTIHQSGLSRASQTGPGYHMVTDSETSSQKEIPIPKILKMRAPRTNFEIVMDKVEERKSIRDLLWSSGRREIEGWRKNFNEKFIFPIKPLLEQLHPRDFGQVYRKLNSERNHQDQIRADMRVCDQVITERLGKMGYSNAEINLFLVRTLDIGNYSSSAKEADAYMFKKVEDLTDAVDLLVEYDIDQATTEMYESLFDSTTGLYSTEDQLLELMGGSIYDVNFEQLKMGIPVTRDTLLDSLEKISKIDNLAAMSGSTKTDAYCEIITRYVTRTFLTLSAEAGTEIDEAQIKEFFQDVKDRGIKIDPSLLISKLEKIYRGIRKGVSISEENKQSVVDAAREVFEREPFILTTEEIDQFFNEFIKEDSNDGERKVLLKSFLDNARGYFDRGNIANDERLYFARYLADKINTTSFQSEVPWLENLQDRYSYKRPLTEQELISNDAIMKFNLNVISAVTFFKQDSDQFYEFIGSSMDKMSPYTNNLSRRQLINLCQGLFLSEDISSLFWLGRTSSDYLMFSSTSIVQISDHERFMNLPMIRKIVDMEENLDFGNLGELDRYAYSQLSRLLFGHSEKPNLYGDRLIDLIDGKGISDNFDKILEKGLEEQDYADLFTFLSNYYPEGPQKDQFLREINKHYLRSPNIAFDQKVDYMIVHFNRVGPEAMVILADQIEDIETYRYFKEKLGARLDAYLEGQELIAVNVVGGVDFLSSFFVKEYEKLLMTCQDDPEVSKQVSTELAGRWFGAVLDSRSGIQYDANLQKFALTAKGRNAFRTLADSFSTLQGLSELQKFAVIHKSFTDAKGALTSPENRKKLATLLTKSLGMEKGFVSSVLSAACTEADAKLIAIPASTMLIPLVFKSLDVKAVDMTKLLKISIWHGDKHVELGEMLSEQAIRDILSADTRSVSVFGARYQNQPSSQAAQLAEESDRQFVSTTDSLSNLLTANGAKPEVKQRNNELDSSTEAVIRGVETSGALGIRALQLAAQFETFPPEVEKRLSETFDSNPGMEKLRFWHNLNKLALDAQEKGDQKIEQYLQRVTLRNYVGGGSLQTTYAAILDRGTPNERQVVVKMRNPNVDQFILESYDSATKTLDYVSSQKGVGRSKQYAQTGRVLMDLAQKWCLDDINDTTYLERDDLFRQTIEQFNVAQGKQMFYAPEREFTTLKLKSETLSPGETFNQFLNNPQVDPAHKKEAVATLTRFFIHQLKNQGFEDSEGKYHLVHSDPHIGNYIVDLTGPDPKFGVIDRSMYLKLSDKDVRVLEKLILPGNDNDFVYGFIDRVLDTNKVRGVQRAIVTGNVLAPVYLEYRRQQSRGSINRLELMRTMFQALADAKVYTPFNARRLDVPLNLRLMIRNIGAFQELGRRYGVDFEALYREAA